MIAVTEQVSSMSLWEAENIGSVIREKEMPNHETATINVMTVKQNMRLCQLTV